MTQQYPPGPPGPPGQYPQQQSPQQPVYVYPPGWQPPQPPTPWYHSSIIIVLSVLFCTPIGLILIWTSKKTSLVTKVVATVIFGGIFVLAVIGNAISKSKSSSSTSSAFAPSPASLTYVTEDCMDLAEKFGASSKLSDLQKDELWKNYEGKAFRWQLKITDVSAGMLGGYKVQAKCAPKSHSLIQDVLLSYPVSAKEAAMALQKDETYTIKGRLTHQSTLLGMSADGLP